MEEYYINSGRKVVDFIIGFFGIWVVNAVLSAILQGISTLAGGYFDAVMVVVSILLFIAEIIFLVFYVRRKRRYIFIGAITALVIPLLLVGACFAIFSVLMSGV